MSFQLDTDVVIDHLRRPGTADNLFDRLFVLGTCVSAMSYGKPWQGVVEHRRQDEMTVVLAKLLEPLRILPLDEATMRIFAVVRSGLKRQGMLLPAQDLLIAATAIQHDLILVTRNQRHFNRIDGLQVASPDDLAG